MQWNETLGFHWPQTVFPAGASNGPALIVMLQVFDHKRLTRDSFLGQVQIDLSMLPPVHNSIHAASEVCFSLRKRTTRSRVAGTITLRMGYDLPAPDANPAAAPDPAATPDASSARLLRASVTDEVDEATELPANIAHTVDRNGRQIYTNTETRQVFGSLEAAMAEPSRSQQQAAQLDNVLAREAQDDDESDEGSLSESAAANGEAASILGSGPLPPGWIMQRTKKGR